MIIVKIIYNGGVVVFKYSMRMVSIGVYLVVLLWVWMSLFISREGFLLFFIRILEFVWVKDMVNLSIKSKSFKSLI